MKKILLWLLAVFMIVPTYAYYEPTEKDFDIIDRIETKIYDAIDSGKITPWQFISKIEYIQETRKLSERVDTILTIIIEDIEYSYYTSYSEDGFEMSPEECFEDEYFDDENKICVLLEEYGEEFQDEDTEESEDYSQDYGNDDFDEASEQDEGFEETSNNSEAIYTIQEDSIILKDGSRKSTHIEIWEVFTKIIPTYYRKDFKLYSVFNDEDDWTVAAVYQDEEDINFWNIDVNSALFYSNGQLDPKESLHTLIHEFAHVLTLNKTQVDYLSPTLESQKLIDRFKDNCKSTFITEGCLKSNAYLELFIQDFWTAEDVEATEVNQQDVYTGNEDSFVTDYASTNPAEDIAETFTYFVLKPKPTGNTVAEQKIEFFYQFEELVNLRKVIRNRIK